MILLLPLAKKMDSFSSISDVDPKLVPGKLYTPQLRSVAAAIPLLTVAGGMRTQMLNDNEGLLLMYLFPMFQQHLLYPANGAIYP